MCGDDDFHPGPSAKRIKVENQENDFDNEQECEVINQRRVHNFEQHPSQSFVRAKWGEDYYIDRVLGEGVYGKVFLVRNEDQREFAMKILRKNFVKLPNVWEKESKIMKEISKSPHQHLVQLERAGLLFTTPIDCSPFAFLMDVMGDSLFEIMSKVKGKYPNNTVCFKTCDIRVIAQQVVEAMSHLDKLHICHLDFKPENIFFSKNDSFFCDLHNGVACVRIRNTVHIKIGDFGNSQVYDVENEDYEMVQTQNYRAPEIFMGLPFTPKADVWSFGCILSEMYSGDLLFYGNTNEDTEAVQFQLIQMIVRQAPPFRMWRQAAKIKSPLVMSNEYGDFCMKQKMMSQPIRCHFLTDNIRAEDIDDQDVISLFELLSKLLIFDPVHRPAFREVSDHQFFKQDIQS